MMQVIVPVAYRGHRVRLSAWVRTEGVRHAGIWMRVDDAAHKILAFDNMQSRPLVGTTEWTRCEVVLDVAPEATRLAFGGRLEGPGSVWLNDVTLEIVGTDIPTTGAPDGTALRCVDPDHDQPLNLRFSDG